MRANRILNIIGPYLIQRVKKQMRDNFKNGQRLNIDEIHNLKNTYKKEYLKCIIKDDNEASDYINKKHFNVVNIHDHVNHSIYQLEDQ